MVLDLCIRSQHTHTFKCTSYPRSLESSNPGIHVSRPLNMLPDIICGHNSNKSFQILIGMDIIIIIVVVVIVGIYFISFMDPLVTSYFLLYEPCLACGESFKFLEGELCCHSLEAFPFTHTQMYILPWGIMQETRDVITLSYIIWFWPCPLFSLFDTSTRKIE